MSKCPNVAGEPWKLMVKEFGTREAYRAFLMDIHDPVEYKKLSDIKLGDWQPYIPQSTDDFGALARDISSRANELKAQGAQVRNMNERGFQYLLPQNKGVYYQQHKLTQDGIKQEVTRVIRSDNNIGKAYRIFAGTKGKGTFRVLQEYWNEGPKNSTGTLRFREEDLLGLNKFPYQGYEHTVYIGDNKVIKINNIASDDILKYLRKLILHNYLFPNTAYKLLGFITKDNKVFPVVEQKEVKGTENNYSLAAIREYLAEKFQMKQSSKESDTFFNEDAGIMVSDLNPHNVIIQNNTLYFIDPHVIPHPDLDAELQEISNYSGNYQLSSINTSVNKQLNDKVTKFLTNLGVSVERVNQIITNSGQSANAMVDTINKIIRVAEGKEQVDTLGHEATHLFLDLLPEGSVLLRDILRDVKSRDEYSTALAEYGGLPEYRDSEGNIDENKIAKEAASDIIGKIIAGTITDRKARSLWQRVWDYIKKLFKGATELSPYEQIASDIVAGDVSKLDTNKVGSGIYYQLSENEERTAREAFKKATPMQKKIIEEVYFEPHSRMALIPSTHEYVELSDPDFKWTSATTAIGQDFPEELKDMYEDNRVWGNDIDTIMQGIILRKNLSDITTSELLSDTVKEQVHNILREYYGSLTADGSIVLPQVIVADKASGIAGSIDILTIDPYGNMKVVDIKSSWSHRGSKAFTDPHHLKANSRIAIATADREKPVTKLNKVQVHGTQIGVYGKLLQLAGWSLLDNSLATKHLYLETIKQFDAEGNFIGTKVTGVQDEGTNYRNPGDNATTVSAIVPTALTNKDRLQEINDEFKVGNPIRTKAFQDKFKIADNIDELLTDKVFEAAGALSDFTKHLEGLKHLSGTRIIRDEAGKIVRTIARFEARDRFVDRMNDLYVLLSKALSHENQVAAYTEFLNFTKEEIGKISKYLATTREVEPGVFIPENVDQPNYIDTALLAIKYIETFQGITDLRIFGNQGQATLLADVVQSLNDTKKDINFAVLHYTAHIGKDYTSKKDITYKDILKLLEKDRDISNSEFNFGTIGNSGVFIIENTAKFIKDRMLAAEENAKERIEQFIPIAEKLRAALGKIDKDSYNFMTRTDREGKKMGQIVSQVGREYRLLQEKVYNDLLDTVGKPLEYIEIKDATTASSDDLAHNVSMWYKKQKVAKFESAEEFDKAGNVETGEYHRYNSEFLSEREKYMYIDQYYTKTGGPYYRWEFNSGETAAEEAKIIAFKRKYFREIPEYMKMDFNNDTPTGVVTKEYGKWVVKGDYVDVRDTEKTSGKDIADAQYLKLMNPTTELGSIQKEYYEAYTNMMGEIIDMLPANAAETFKKGNIPTVGSTWVQQLANGNINMGALLANAIKAQLETPVEMGKDTAAASGSSRQSIPLLYVAPIQSQLQLDKIAAERNILNDVNNPLSEQQKAIRRKELDNDEKRERLRMKAADLHPDLTLGLTEMIKAATQFQAKSDMESSLIALKSQLGNMEFEQRASKFGKLVGTNLVSGENSNAYKRWAGFMDMCFYHDPLMNRSTADAVVKKLMGITSVLGVSFNVFGWFNNVVTGTLNNAIDGLGGNFWNPKAMRRMTLEFQTAALGYAKNVLAHKNQKLFGKGTYEDRKAGSKYEAICDHFHAIEHYQAELRGQFSVVASLGGYAGMEAGEYMMQSKVATAILASIPITNTTTGEQTTVYDAYKWDEKSGKVVLKDGYELSSKEQHLITNRIRETIDRIHGNYSPENKTMFEKEWWGTLIMQFHKWFWPNFKQRFQPAKYDENLGGGMDIEGRYRTLWNFVKGLNNLADLTDATAWNRLTDHQKANLKKDIADAGIIISLFVIGHVIKSLADGIPDDDPQLKRWVHYLQYQTDRSIQETSLFVPGLGLVESYQLLKNPIAGAGSIRQFGELVQAAYKYPFIDDEHRYYQRGPYVGTSHIAKEARDVFPIMYEWNRIKALATTSTFFVK